MKDEINEIVKDICCSDGMLYKIREKLIGVKDLLQNKKTIEGNGTKEENKKLKQAKRMTILCYNTTKGTPTMFPEEFIKIPGFIEWVKEFAKEHNDMKFAPIAFKQIYEYKTGDQ